MSAVNDCLRLTFDKVSLGDPLAGWRRYGQEGSAGPDEPLERQENRFPVAVILDVDSLIVDAGQLRRIYDFKGKRVLQVDSANRTYGEWSLYSDLAFRVHEFRNRAMMAGVFQEAAVDIGSLGDLFEQESVFSLVLPDPGPKSKGKVDFSPGESAWGKAWGAIFGRGRPAEQSFSRDGRVVARVLPSPHPLLQKHRRGFDRFLIYESMLHPSIRRSILKAGTVPQRLETRVRVDVADITTTWNLVEYQPAESIGETVPGGFERIWPDGPLGAVLARLSSGDPPPSREAMLRFFHQSHSEGKLLDALLGALEWYLQSGEHLSFLKQHAPEINADPLCRTVLASRDVSSPEAAERTLQMLEEIDTTGLAKGLVLEIWKAVSKMKMRDLPGAEALYLRALEKNPYITGVYKDLGDVYFQGYFMEHAWLCWDTARRLYPHHPMLTSINQMEENMELGFPDFF